MRSCVGSSDRGFLDVQVDGQRICVRLQAHQIQGGGIEPERSLEAQWFQTLVNLDVEAAFLPGQPKVVTDRSMPVHALLTLVPECSVARSEERRVGKECRSR